MKKKFLQFPRLIGGVVVGVIAGLLLPAEWRAKLSQPLAVLVGRMVEQMPDG